MECTDFFDNPGDVPAPGSNETAYIRIFRRGDTDDPLFEGVVREGSVYDVLGENNDRLPADMRIDIYPADETVFNGNTILQSVEFHSSCSQPLLCFNTFGGHQIVGWENERQGSIDCFDDVFIRVNIIVTVDIDEIPASSDTVELTELFVTAQNYVRNPGPNSRPPELIDLSDQIRGQLVGPNLAPARANYTASLDLRFYQEYNALIRSFGQTPNGFECDAGINTDASFCAPVDDPQCVPPPLP